MIGEMKLKKFKKALISALVLLLSAAPLCVSAAQPGENSAASGETPYRSYTYWTEYDNRDKIPSYSKPMYEVSTVIDSKQLGDMLDSKLNDLAVDNSGNTYLLDSGNSRVYILDSSYTPVKVLRDLTYNGQSLSFTDAKGIYADKNGNIFICDTKNARVLILDGNGTVLKELLLPDSELIPSGFEYKPIKVAVDSKGYTYIACDGSYYGAILYSPEMEFLGFFGANTVKATVTDVIKSLWKKLTSNDTKRASDEISLPYTFTDLVVDSDDFIYTATGRSGEDQIQYGQICRLNPGGKDILNASDLNFADYQIGALKRSAQIQDLSSIAVDSDGFFYALDTTYGRVFWYDSECSLLSVFGGSMGDGNQKGTFRLPSGIAVNGTDILVSDSQKNSLTVFKATDYALAVRTAQLKTLSDDFASALEDWQTVASLDSESQLAYRGLAKAYYDMGDNENAMKYAKLGADRETYADAFKEVRSKRLENSFGFIFAGVIVLAAAIALLSVYKRKHAVVLVKNETLKTALSSVAHPAESFRLVKEKHQGSVMISTVILLLLYIVTVLNDTAGGFAFTYFDTNNYNALYVLLSTVGLVVLWTVCNFLVCTLAGGIGKLSEIYCVTCYSLIPVLFGRACNLILTHLLVPDEGAFLSIFLTVCTLYTAFMLIIGIMKIHDYEFGKFVGTTIFSVIGMMIVVFLIFLVFMLSQQVFGWIKTLYIELIYR